MTSEQLLDLPEEVGIFTWCLDTGKLYADTAVAALLGYDADLTISGFSIGEFLDRLHHEDQERVTGLVSEAVRSGGPYRAEYRIVTALGVERNVVALGRCFRNESGTPNYFSGIIYAVNQLNA